jgi:hypothetical protein
LIGRPLGKHPLGKLKRRFEDVIKRILGRQNEIMGGG